MKKGWLIALWGMIFLVLGIASVLPYVMILLIAFIASSPVLFNISVFAGAVLLSLLAPSLTAQQLISIAF